MSVKSSRSMFHALRHLAEANGPLSAAQLSDVLELPMTTALRVLATLEAAGYAERLPSTSQFVIGKAATTLSLAYLAHFPARDLALPYLQSLTQNCGLTTSLFVRIGWYAARAAIVMGANVETSVNAIGEIVPLTDSLPALAMAASLDAVRDVHDAPLSPEMQARIDEKRAELARLGGLGQPSHQAPDALDIAIPLKDAAGQAVACVMFDAVPPAVIARLENKEDSLYLTLLALSNALAAQDPATLSPYGHIPAGKIRF